jgi:aminoglycoside phosphotransferase (APT) family kinase protein
VTATTAELTRRLDWRFLLPRDTFRRAVLVGADPELLECARRIGLADVVDGETDGRPADLVFISSADDSASLPDLTPDGIVCCEVDRRRTPTLSPARLARRLDALGLRLHGIWAVRPGLGRAESYVPIDSPAPMPWFLGTHYHASSPVQRLASTAVRALVRDDGRRLAPLVPLFVAVAARSERRDGSVLVLTDSGGRAVQLSFADDERAPRDVTKVPKSEPFVERTRREQESLVSLRTRLPHELADALPDPLGLRPWGSVEASCERAVPGVIVTKRCQFGQRHRADATRDLAEATAWLARFHAATRSDTGDAGAHVRRWCEQYADRFADPGNGMLADVYAASERLPRITPVVRHPDFNIWNLIRDGDGLRVIDWEGSAPGPPVCDLVQLVVHWHETVSRRRPQMPDGRVLRAVLLDRSDVDWSDRAAADSVAAYMTALAIPDEWFLVLGVATWVERALRRERQRLDSGSPRVDRDRDNFGVRYLEVLAQEWTAERGARCGLVAP